MFPQYIRAYRGAKKSHQVQYEQQRPVASQVVHIEHRAGRAWPRGFGALINSSPHF